jgi:hypothetical protein
MRTIDNPAQLKLDLFTSQPINAQSDIPEVRYLHPQPVSSHSLKLADKLDKLAATMQATIDSKLHPAIGQQNITARRSRIATQMREEGERLALIQRWLEGLANAHRTATCPHQFAKIDNRKQLTDLAYIYHWHRDDPKYLENCFVYNYSIVERLKLFGIKSKDEAIAAVELLDSLCFGNLAPEIDRSLEMANELRRRAIYTLDKRELGSPVFQNGVEKRLVQIYLPSKPHTFQCLS